MICLKGFLKILLQRLVYFWSAVLQFDTAWHEILQAVKTKIMNEFYFILCFWSAGTVPCLTNSGVIGEIHGLSKRESVFPSGLYFCGPWKLVSVAYTSIMVNGPQERRRKTSIKYKVFPDSPCGSLDMNSQSAFSEFYFSGGGNFLPGGLPPLTEKWWHNRWHINGWQHVTNEKTLICHYLIYLFKQVTRYQTEPKLQSPQQWYLGQPSNSVKLKLITDVLI